MVRCRRKRTMRVPIVGAALVTCILPAGASIASAATPTTLPIFPPPSRFFYQDWGSYNGAEQGKNIDTIVTLA
jgi:hypothetical protein